MPEYELRFQYTPAIAQRAVLASLWDVYSVYVVSSVVVFAACAFELKNAEMRPLACFGLGVIAMLWWSWLRAYQSAGRVASGLRDPEMRIRLSDAGIEFCTADATSSLSWSAVRSVRRFSDIWILEQRVVRSRRPVPVAALTPEAKELIVRMVSNAGGLVQ